MARPWEMASSEATVWASSAGVRLYTGTIPVPKRTFVVWQAIMVRSVKASRPQDSPTHTLAYPKRSAKRAMDTISSVDTSRRLPMATPSPSMRPPCPKVARILA